MKLFLIEEKDKENSHSSEKCWMCEQRSTCTDVNNDPGSLQTTKRRKVERLRMCINKKWPKPLSKNRIL